MESADDARPKVCSSGKRTLLLILKLAQEFKVAIILGRQLNQD